MADVDQISPDKLHLDLRNPRTPDQEFKDELEVLQYLVQNYDIDELVLSILGAGSLDFEPFHCTAQRQCRTGGKSSTCCVEAPFGTLGCAIRCL